MKKNKNENNKVIDSKILKWISERKESEKILSNEELVRKFQELAEKFRDLNEGLKELTVRIEEN